MRWREEAIEEAKIVAAKAEAKRKEEAAAARWMGKSVPPSSSEPPSRPPAVTSGSGPPSKSSSKRRRRFNGPRCPGSSRRQLRARAIAGSHRRRAARRHRPQSAPLLEIRNCSVESFIVEKCTTTKGSTAHACTRIQLLHLTSLAPPHSLSLSLSLSHTLPRLAPTFSRLLHHWRRTRRKWKRGPPPLRVCSPLARRAQQTRRQPPCYLA